MQNLAEKRLSSSNTLILNLILSPLYQLRIDQIPQEKWGKAFSILGMKRNNCIRKVLIMMQTHSTRTRSNLSFGCGFREFIFERTRKAKHMQLLCAAKSGEMSTFSVLSWDFLYLRKRCGTNPSHLYLDFFFSYSLRHF